MPRKVAMMTSSQIEADVAALRTELLEATSDADRLADGRKQLLLHGTDEALAAHDLDLASAGRRRDRAAAKLEVSEQQYADALTREAAESRAERVAEAHRAAAAAAEAITAWHTHVAAATLAMLRQVAEADILVDAVNAERGADDLDVLRSEARVRDVAGLPAELLGEKTVNRWCFSETGNVLSDETAARVISGDGRKGTISGGTMSMSAIYVERRVFIERRILPARPSRSAFGHSFAQSVTLPGLRADDPATWSPLMSDSPEAVLAQLHAKETAPDMPDEREPLIELIPIAPHAEAAE